MRILMLGWEFPPFIAGGLGTACHGLTKAMDQRGLEVKFVLPHVISNHEAEHVSLISPASVEQFHAAGEGWDPDDPEASLRRRPGFRHARFLSVPTPLAHPYQQSEGEGPVGAWPVAERATGGGGRAGGMAGGQAGHAGSTPTVTRTDYGGDLIDQVEQYAAFCLEAAHHLEFDVIHAHDWMTYPAGLWIARLSGKPLVVHVHSTEFDRSGEHVNQRVYDIERRGMHGAMRVIAVSQLTKNVIVNRYGVPDRHVAVVYNGVDLDAAQVGLTGIQSKDKIVLYFGRITYQKGPEYFVRAAKRVLEHRDDVKFVVAGSGDQARGMIEMAAHLGIGHKVLFVGFLRGEHIRKVFAMADLYVMPSISEPFGIAPLEAMGHHVPVLISKTSGVSEVLTHALKVDFWDVEDMANKIIAVLKYPPLGKTLREHGAMEVRRLTWEGAATRCESIYHEVVGEMVGVG